LHFANVDLNWNDLMATGVVITSTNRRQYLLCHRGLPAI
jgi:hypothetical protein